MVQKGGSKVRNRKRESEIRREEGIRILRKNNYYKNEEV